MANFFNYFVSLSTYCVVLRVLIVAVGSPPDSALLLLCLVIAPRLPVYSIFLSRTSTYTYINQIVNCIEDQNNIYQEAVLIFLLYDLLATSYMCVRVTH